MAITYDTYCYLIVPQTNLHVGSGDASYGVVDKLVQRDPVTKLPTIHSSSLKGGLREFFEENVGWGKNSDEVRFVFGSDPTRQRDFKNGEYRFFNADLLFLPVRSSQEQYFLGTEANLLKALNERLALLGAKSDSTKPIATEAQAWVDVKIDPRLADYPLVAASNGRVVLEDWEAKALVSPSASINNFNGRFHNKVALLHESHFRELSDNLPVIARNYLENGISENLWYEEVVPRQAIFYTFVSVPKRDKKEGEANAPDNFFTKFDEAITKQGATVQLGANASIGYGCCKFYRLDQFNSL